MLAHLHGEVEELDEEVQLLLDGDPPGTDGIVGESVDVILCALDVISVHSPDITGVDVTEIMRRKFNKWYGKYHKD